MENEVKIRVKKVLKSKKISVNSLAKSSGISQATINDQINRSTKISVSALGALLSFCPELSAEWLMRGDGEMFIVPTEGTPRDDRENSEQITKDKPRNDQGTTNEVIALLSKQIEQLEYIVELQKDRILQLEKKCEDLKKANSTAATSHATTA